MKVSELPARYAKLAKLRASQQEFGVKDDEALDAMFKWRNTPEGVDFWRRAHTADYKEQLPKLDGKTLQDIEDFEISGLKSYISSHYDVNISVKQVDELYYAHIQKEDTNNQVSRSVAKTETKALKRALINIIKSYGQED